MEMHGKFNSKGELMIYGSEKMSDFGSKNKDKTVLITVRVFEPKSSHAFLGYYRNKFLIDIQRAFALQGNLKSIESIDKMIRGLCPITYKEVYDPEKRKYKISLIDIEDLEKWQMEIFIDKFLRPWALENLNVFIDSTITL